MLKRLLTSNIFFGLVAAAFILSLTGVAVTRGGKDLKVGLFGVEQTLHKKSPYENPLDPNRPIFRYAPGFAILQYPFLMKSKMVAPYEFQHMRPSIIAWYLAGVLSLFAGGWILLKLIPAASPKISFDNLKLGFLLSMPLLGYELANSQNKLLALFFTLAALFLFEKKRMFWASFFFNLALTIYIPLFVFAFYFILRSKGKFLPALIAGALVVFLLLPSLVFGFGFNLYLLKDWFARCLKPFFFTTSYVSYIDLRTSSQSLPSALGRIFVSGHTGTFKYLISPVLLHILIRTSSAIIVLASCWAVWKNSKENFRGLGYAIFLLLALVLPSYCIYYSWAWLFVFYFAAFNLMSLKQTPTRSERFLRFSIPFLVASSWAFSIHPFNHLSFLCWATLLFWANMSAVLLEDKS